MATGDDDKLIVVGCINQAVDLINASRPKTR